MGEMLHNTLFPRMMIHISFFPQLLKYPRPWIMKYYIFLVTKNYVTWWWQWLFVFISNDFSLTLITFPNKKISQNDELGDLRKILCCYWVKYGAADRYGINGGGVL